MGRFFRPLLMAGVELLWPARCAGCDGASLLFDDGPPLCEDCRSSLSPLLSHSICRRCAAPLCDSRCRDCRRLPPVLARIFAPYEYGGALADALLRLKWQGRDDLGRPLGSLLGPALSRRAADFDFVVPVPLHPRRLRERGYNQAVLLTRAGLAMVAKKPRPVLLPTALFRLRFDSPARGVGPEQRFFRTQDAFAVRPWAKKMLAGKRVLIVDDVVTTGATALGCAEALSAAGATHIEALALLRAPP